MNETIKNILSTIIKAASIAVTYQYPEYALFTSAAELSADTILTLIPPTSKLSVKKLSGYIYETIKEVYKSVPINSYDCGLSKKKLEKLSKKELKDYISTITLNFDENYDANVLFSYKFTLTLLEKAQEDFQCYNFLSTIYTTNFQKSIIDLYGKVNELDTKINGHNLHKQIQIISKDSGRPKSTFVNRTEIGKLINEIEKNENYIVVLGIGGIGKTELCKKIFWDYLNNRISNSVSFLAWINYTSDLQTSLLNAFPNFINQSQPTEKCIDDLCKYLNSLGTSLLMFIDNANKTQVEDNFMSIIKRLSCRIVITTRVDIFSEKETLRLGEMTDEECQELFYNNFRNEIPKEKTGYVSDLIALCSKHTLTIELIAKTANNFDGGIDELYLQLIKTNFKIPALNQKVTFDEYEMTIIEHLKKLFSLVKLNDTCRNVLLRLSLMPYNRYSQSNLLKWKIANNNEQFIILITFGWLSSEYDSKISMHPIVAQVISNVVKITYKKFIRTIEAMTEELEINQSTQYYSLFETAIVAEHMSLSLNFKTELYANFLSNIGVILCKSEERERAINLYERALEIKEMIGSSDASLSDTYNNLSIAHRYNEEKSLYYAGKSLEKEKILFAIQPNIQAEHYATTLNNHGLSNMNLSKVNSHDEYHIKAEKSFLEALRIRCDYNLDVHGCSQVYNNMGLMYSKAGDLYKGLMMHMLSALDETSPNLAIHKYNLGKSTLYIYNKKYIRNSLILVKQIGQKNLEESLSLFRINEKMNLNKISRVIDQLEMCYKVVGDDRKLIELYELKKELNV